MKIKILLWTLILTVFHSSCKKFVDINAPSTSTNAEIVFSSDASAIAVLTGIYTKMSQNGITNGIGSASLFPALSADELELFSGVSEISWINYYRNNLNANQIGSGDNFWASCYSYIFTANSAVEGLTTNDLITSSVKHHLLGEAKFIRAFCYFYLVNIYGDVPMVLSTDYKVNSNIPRSSTRLIYDQILKDLTDAQNLLSEEYLDGTLLRSSTRRVSPTKWAATALLARVNLYLKNYADAEKEATKVIDNNQLFQIASIDDAFKADNKEVIWGLQPVDDFITNTSDARLFILPTEGPNEWENKVYLTRDLIRSFEIGDKRKLNWIDSVTTTSGKYLYAKKYRNNNFFSQVTENTIVFRLAELYLVRAEARANLNRLQGSNSARSDIDVLRTRAGLPNTNAASLTQFEDVILKERRSELFTEWGHRWFDLKRLNKATTILQAIKGANWQSTDQYYPIPQSEIDRNPMLRGQQNPGYN